MGRCEKESAVLLVLEEVEADLGARSSDVPTALGGCDAGASPEPVRCAALVVDACGYDRDGSAAPAAG